MAIRPVCATHLLALLPKTFDQGLHPIDVNLAAWTVKGRSTLLVNYVFMEAVEELRARGRYLEWYDLGPDSFIGPVL